MEKAFYFLLLQYRNKNLENYNGETDSPRLDSHPIIQQAITLPSADVRRHSTTGAIEKKRIKERGERRVTSRRGSVSAVVPTHHHVKKSNREKGDKENIAPKTASRPAPPAPGKSPMTPSRRNVIGGPRPPSRGATPAASPNPDVPHKSTIRLVQQRELESDSPRTPPQPLTQQPINPISPTPTPAKYAVDPRLPKIHVQVPTPQNDTPLAAGLGLNMPIQPQQPSTPSPAPASERVAASGMTGSPPIGSISVPKVQDAALQKFFHDIAEQLQLIGSASPRSSIAIETPAPTPTLVQDELMPSPLQIGREYNDVDMEAPITSPPPPPPARIERPLPVRAQTDMPVAPPLRQDPVRRRSYLGDASERDNVRPIENLPTPVRRVSQTSKERKVSGKSITGTTGTMKRKTKRKFSLWRWKWDLS